MADGLHCNIVFLAKEVYCNRRARLENCIAIQGIVLQ